MPYTDGEITYYLYGDDDAPVGAGKGAQSYSEIVAAAKASGEKFEDQLFPATSASIGAKEEKGENEIKWCRPAEIAEALFKAKPVFKGEVSEFNVKQGGIGDCFYMATIASVATKPKCFNRVVPEDNTDAGFDVGAFHFRFWNRGKWTDVVIDDRLPCKMKKAKPNEIWTCLFCKPLENGGFWPSLIEKAYAKLFGSYQQLKGGYGVDVMVDFTGGFTRTLRTTEPHIVEIMKDAIKKDCLMTFGTKPESQISDDLLKPHDPNNPGTEVGTKYGIALCHEYSLLDIQDVKDKKDPTKVHTLVKARNPWGSAAEWLGDFGDTDPNNAWGTVDRDLRRTDVSTKLRKQDGEFWISWKDLELYIGGVEVCLWSNVYHGIKPYETKDGRTCVMEYGSFTKESSGDVKNNLVFKGKTGFYVHLEPVDPNAPGDVKDGLTYNCDLLVSMIWLNYTNTGWNPQIPKYRFYVLWAPGKVSPADEDFFDNIKITQNTEGHRHRGISEVYKLPAGTAFIVPWLPETPSVEHPYYFRVAAEGDIFPFPVPESNDDKVPEEE